jgi:hypothetical protein
MKEKHSQSFFQEEEEPAEVAEAERQRVVAG